MIETVNFIIGIILVIGAFLFAYVSSVIVHENKTGKCFGKRNKRIKINVMGQSRDSILEFSIRDMGILWSTCAERIYNRTFEIRRENGTVNE